jgi:predicted Rossmann fold flavoprotein
MKETQRQRHLVVVGGGAAGFFCAVNAARMDPMLRVTILEKSSKVLSKVKVSGGGRCNVTHDCDTVDDLIEHYPRGRHFLRKAFHHFSCADTRTWFTERGVPLKAEADGRVFPESNSSQSIIDCLFREVNQFGVEILMNVDVTDVDTPEPAGGKGFRVKSADGRSWTADAVMLATGGLPRSGAPSWLPQSGHRIIPPVPSLFTFNIPGHPLTALMGISLPAELSLKGTKLKEAGPLLITHWGLSGPAVLRLSAWGARELHDMDYRFGITVNFLPGRNETGIREEFRMFRMTEGLRALSAHNPFLLPARLWNFLLDMSGIGAQDRWNGLTSEQQNRLAVALCRHELNAHGKTTFKEEFVTAGGVSLSDVDPHTMQSRKQPGLFFGGELLDVDGITGGYNFQHAWTSGWLAARSVAAAD